MTKPLEAIVKGINGVEHVYSQTQDDRVMVTARFFVGTNRGRCHPARAGENPRQLRPHPDRHSRAADRRPRHQRCGRSSTLTLSPKPEAAARWTDKDLYELADRLRSELIKVDNIGLSYISGGTAEQIRVEPDPEKLALFGVTLQQLVAKVRGANRSFLAGTVRDAGIATTVAAGQTLSGVPDIGLLLVTTRDGRPVYVRDVAKVVVGGAPVEHRVWTFTAGQGAALDARARRHASLSPSAPAPMRSSSRDDILAPRRRA